MKTKNSRTNGFSLLEMLAAVTIMGVIALIIIPRMSGSTDGAKKSTCHVNKGNIETQCQLWFRNKGVWPKTDLSDIGADGDYFPDGLAKCPFDQSQYRYNSSSETVTGHAHN